MTGLKFLLIAFVALGVCMMVVITHKMHNRRNKIKARQYAFNRSMFID